ncbi:dihydrofolate reductase family protein [Actinophytocola sediminis]
MRRLLPDRVAEVDLIDAFTQPRDQVRLGMVMSVDGSVTDEEGWTANLGGAADRRVLRALRASADAILVGAGSVRTGRYPPHRPTGEIRETRRRAGRAEAAPLVVVTRSGDLDWSLPVFTEARTPTYVVTCARSPVAGRRDHVLVHGETDIDLPAALADLRARFGGVLCEGGPGLATAMFTARLVDELVLSIAPSILPGEHPRLVRDLAKRQELTLTELYEEGGEVFLRYGVTR